MTTAEWLSSRVAATAQKLKDRELPFIMPTQESMPLIEANASLVAPEDQQQLVAVVRQNNLQPETALSLQTTFAPLFAQARALIEKSKGIVVTDANQKLEIKMARACRLELKAIRVAGDKLRKEVKEESLRRSKAIDGFGNILEDVIRTEEDRLQRHEDFAAIQEQERKAALKEAREKVLASIQVEPNLYQLGDMTEETFQQLVEGTKLARAAEAERVRKAEAERIAREAKDAADREAQRLENARLKKEADEREAARVADVRRRGELHFARRLEMQTFVETGDESTNAQYGDLTDDQYGEVKAGAANRREARVKLEGERKKAEEAAAEIRRVAAANAAKVQAANAKKIAEMKRQNDARANAQRIEKEKIEADLKAERDAQAKRKADADEAARKAAAAPDKDRLLNYANAIRALEIPMFATPTAQAVGQLVASQREKYALWVEQKAEAL